jgi:hypothetical protein
MKLTNFTVFIILLVVLIISLFFSKWINVEPFISYNYTANTNISSNQVSVPPYSTTKSVYKVYDSIYYDSQNGNVIELFGTPYTNSVDTTGQSLTNMILMPRAGSLVVEYDAANSKGGFSNVAESSYLNAQLTSSYTSWYYPNSSNTSSKLTNSIEYQVFCFPWKTDTVLFVNDIMKKATVGIFSYIGSSPNGLVKTVNYNIAYNINNKSDYNHYMGPGTTIPGYNGQVGSNIYAVYSNIWFDTQTGSIIYVDTTKSASSAATDTSLQFATSNRNYTIINSGNNIILGIPFSTNRTMIAVLGGDQSNSSYLTILNVVRFDPSMPNGIDSTLADSGVKPPAATAAPAAPPASSCSTTAPSCGGGAPAANPYAFNPSDYIAKTQIVPPVCPACPAMPPVPTAAPASDTLVSVITQLKDLGIINTVGGSPPTQAPPPPQTSQNVSANGPTNPGWGLANNILSGTGNVLTSAENVVGNTAGNVIGGATQIGTGAVSGATQIGTSAISGAANVGVGAENVIGSVASNVSNVASNAISGATALGVGAENVIGNVATNLIGGATNLGTGAENVVGKAVGTAGNLAGKTVDTAGNVIGTSVKSAGNVIGGTVNAASNVVGGTVNAASNVVTGAENIVGGTVNTAGNLAGKVVTSAENTIGNVAAASMPVNIHGTGPISIATAAPQQQMVGPSAVAASQVIGMPNQPSNITGGNVYTGSGAPSAPQEDQYEYVYEEIVPEDEYEYRRGGRGSRALPPVQATPPPQIIYIQAPTPASAALMPTMPPMPTEEIYECEDEDDEEEERPKPKKEKKHKKSDKGAPHDQIADYYYNVPVASSGGYFGSSRDSAADGGERDFLPMSSDLSKFGR